MGDLALFNNLIAADIVVQDGQPIIDDGLETAVLISLYSGLASEYWGNEIESNRPDYQYGGLYENLSNERVLNVAQSLRLEQAALSDLNWILSENLASQIDVSGEIANNTFFLHIKIEKPDETSINLKFDLNWEAQINNPAGDQ